MTGETPIQAGVQQPPQGYAAGGQAQASDQDKALAKDWLRRIDEALTRPSIKEAVKRFETNRKLLRGIDPKTNDGKFRSNQFFANLAMIRPQVYAKDPEFAIAPSKSVPKASLAAAQKFADTAETVLSQELVKGCKLKKRAKRLLTACFTTSVGWWKLCWQENKRTDPLIANQLKDTQDNLNQLQALRAKIEDPTVGQEQDLLIAQLQQTIQGLQSQAEVTVSRGLVLDFVLSEDVLILDPGIRELGDYERSSAIAHRVWMTRETYRKTFGKDATKAKGYTEKPDQSNQLSQNGTSNDKNRDLLCVWEIWDQDSNRVFHVCDGEEGFCREPFSPDWTGRRWYPFFALMWNEVDGAFYPLSDIELIEEPVREYNEAREDFVKDRRGCLPLNIARKGGSLTDEDLKRLANRKGGDLVLVEGVGGQPLANDIWSGSLGQIDPKNYDTSAARADIEQMIGGGDAARGTVMKAKTATEAEIMAQGLRGRSAERQDVIEDLLTELGEYALQVCLRKLTPEEVKRIAGEDASWPSMGIEEIFDQIYLSVRGGSTGRPNEMQDQDRWTKLQPVIEKTVMTVADLYSKGQVQLGQALVAMLRETIRRFDERIDLDQYLPSVPEQGEQDPAQLMQENQQLQAQVKELLTELQQAKELVEKGYVSAAAQIATSAMPAAGVAAFEQVMQILKTGEADELPEVQPAPVQQAMQPAQTGIQ